MSSRPSGIYRDENAFEDRARNEPVRKFTEIMSSLVEGRTMVIPFGESLPSNLDG
jgi:(4S)-4-hydroxy-5-phosphonooxypentane-2,3-dione isomerase